MAGLSASVSGCRPFVAGLDDDPSGLGRVVGQLEEIEVLRVDLPLRGHRVPQPVDHAAASTRRPNRITGKVLHLAGLDQRQRLEQLVQRAVPAREDDERHGVLHEHRLADEEELEDQAAA